MQSSIRERIDQAMDDDMLTSLPGVLHDRGVAHVPHMLEYVQLARHVRAAMRIQAIE